MLKYIADSVTNSLKTEKGDILKFLRSLIIPALLEMLQVSPMTWKPQYLV